MSSQKARRFSTRRQARAIGFWGRKGHLQGSMGGHEMVGEMSRRCTRSKCTSQVNSNGELRHKARSRLQVMLELKSTLHSTIRHWRLIDGDCRCSGPNISLTSSSPRSWYPSSRLAALQCWQPCPWTRSAEFAGHDDAIATRPRTIAL